LPINPKIALKKFGNSLANYEKAEILDFKEIYCIGIGVEKSNIQTLFLQNENGTTNFDDEKFSQKNSFF
jgi:hypothetical protein